MDNYSVIENLTEEQIQEFYEDIIENIKDINFLAYGGICYVKCNCIDGSEKYAVWDWGARGFKGPGDGFYSTNSVYHRDDGNDHGWGKPCHNADTNGNYQCGSWYNTDFLYYISCE